MLRLHPPVIPVADMTDTLCIALGQINPTVGDIRGNLERVLAARAEAAGRGADLVVFPELVVTGYPPEDLVLKPFFLDQVQRETETFVRDSLADGGPAVLIGLPWRRDGRLYNAVLLCQQGSIDAIQLKYDLPNYGVFDEKRVFSAGPLPVPMAFRGRRLGVLVCEDMWKPEAAAALAAAGAELLVVVNGSPFEMDKQETRVGLARQRVGETGLPLLYVNQVGGQDELVFDGASFALDATGTVRAHARAFEEDLAVTRWQRTDAGRWDCADGTIVNAAATIEAIYQAMMVGLRDYVNKNRFPGVILGLSGGIDSALSAAVAVDALGPDRVHCVMMPSPFTSRESIEDAAEVAEMLGCRLDTIGIEPAMTAFDRMLAPAMAGTDPDITEENIQSRARGVTLMALSNKFGAMVLSTGNKSEMSVGYATIYGDMCGGYSVLKDVYKTTVYQLSHWRNHSVPPGGRGPAGQVIPDRVLTKAPTAELRPNQTDQDSLPPYAVLDDILQCLIEREMGIDDIAARGHAPVLVNRVWRMLDLAEYKRRQAPPGVKISRRSFGRDRRYPITNAFSSIL